MKETLEAFSVAPESKVRLRSHYLEVVENRHYSVSGGKVK
jgi:hypothetical protein